MSNFIGISLFSGFIDWGKGGVEGLAASLDTNEWHHAVVNVTDGSIQIYLDAEQVAEKPRKFSSYDNDNSVRTYIGNIFNGGEGDNNHFHGALDEFRIYNRALSECEIKSLYTGEDECPPMLVTLANFTATPFQNDIRVHWETASEVDNAGFHLWRAIGKGWKTGDYSQVIRLTDPLIPSKSTKVGGYPYSYVDSNVESGISYYYGLEDIDFNGQSTVHWDFIDEATAK